MLLNNPDVFTLIVQFVLSTQLLVFSILCFLKEKSRLMISPSCLCIFVCPLPTFESISIFLWKIKNTNIPGDLNLKFTYCFIEITEEPLQLDKRSLVQWIFMDIPTIFIWIIILFGGTFEYGYGTEPYVRRFILAVSSVCRRLTPLSQTGVQITLAREKLYLPENLK
jgi:hypothetical protein